MKISSRAARVAMSFLLVASLGISALVSMRVFYYPISAPLRHAGLELKQITPENSLIAAADNGDPTVLYYAERKGWHFLEKDGIYDGDPDGAAPAIADLERLREKGAKYVVLTSNTLWWLDLYPELRQHLDMTSRLTKATSGFRIYELNPK